ncbi:hypothetical protein LJR289_003466 [Pseudoduganella sp. LjRoot289]|uniref:hypothetical protein n=1 Tax=Pseudoduganella sp. LjRoot289 TaxID=3342314 RepID=UPI003ED0D14F
MNAKHLIAALTVFAASASAFAADAPAADSAKPQQQQSQQQQQQPAPVLLASAATDNAYANVNYPSALVKKNGPRSRAEVKAEAVEAVRNHRSTDSQQFDFYK